MRFPRLPPDYQNVLNNLTDRQKLLDVLHQASALPDGRYLHWDDLRHRSPPAGLTTEQWWTGMRLARSRAATPIREMTDIYGEPFFFVPLPAIQHSLHRFDRMNVAKELVVALGDDGAITEYRVRQLVEEAISSSVIEGARPTTREVARQMVRENRAPISRDETMILNNWNAMRRILALRDEGRPLAIDDLLELHRILGEDALDVPDAAGRFRESKHDVAVTDLENNTWHRPPDAAGLPGRVEALLKFASQTSGPEDPTFIHPILRAIVVHFWVGYEHPFRDGNGRIARALYYWCMLRNGYEMAEFLSISGPIDRSPKAYYMAFAYTETDGGDLTYFILNQLGVMKSALDELLEHLRRRARRMKVLADAINGFDDLNHRQRAVLQHAIRHPHASYTIEGHASSHRVHYQTARNDFAQLVTLGFLEERRVGKGKRFRPTQMVTKLSGRESVA